MANVDRNQEMKRLDEISIRLLLVRNDVEEERGITCIFCTKDTPCEYGLVVRRQGERALVGLHLGCIGPLKAKNPAFDGEAMEVWAEKLAEDACSPDAIGNESCGTTYTTSAIEPALQRVESFPRWTVSVYLERDGAIMLIYHNAYLSWLPVGGGIEAGERPVDAVIREVREETGFSIKNVQYVEFEEHWAGTRIHMNHVHRAEVITSGEPRTDGSWRSSRWIRPSEALPEGTPDNVRKVMNKLQKREV